VILLYLDKKSETLKVIQQLRNEAHRLGHITAINSKAALNSSIESILELEKTMLTLIQHFKSVKRLVSIRKEITEVIDCQKPKIVDFTMLCHNKEK
jgi:excinuclease ABC subunit C